MKISVDARELFHTLQTDAGMNVLVELQMDADRSSPCRARSSATTSAGVFKHVDFIRIARDEKITVEIPVQLVGESFGVKEGGVVEHHLWSSRSSVPPGRAHLGRGRHQRRGAARGLQGHQLTFPDTVTILTDADESIVSVVPPQVRKSTKRKRPEAAEARGGGRGRGGGPTAAESGSSDAPQE